jgi:hypothetical protein
MTASYTAGMAELVAFGVATPTGRGALMLAHALTDSGLWIVVEEAPCRERWVGLIPRDRTKPDLLWEGDVGLPLDCPTALLDMADRAVTRGPLLQLKARTAWRAVVRQHPRATPWGPDGVLLMDDSAVEGVQVDPDTLLETRTMGPMLGVAWIRAVPRG